MPHGPSVLPRSRKRLRPRVGAAGLSTSLLLAALAVALQAGASPTLAAAQATARCWQVVANPGPSGANLRGVSGTSSTDVWAVGAQVSDPEIPFIMHWDGTAWTISPAEGVNGVTQAVAAVSPADAWAVGRFGRSAALHWDGASWRKVPTPAPQDKESLLYDVVALAPDDIWGVGLSQTPTGSDVEALTMHWDGTAWTIFPIEPVPSGGIFYSVAASSPTDVWAVGYQDDPGPGLFQPLVEHWDGTSWSVVSVPKPPPPSNFSILEGVTAVSSDDAWAVGLYSYVRWQALLYHWDGEAWTRVPHRLQAMNALYGVDAVSANDVWAVGEHDPNFTDYYPMSLHWDGIRWTVVPGTNPGLHAKFFDVAAISSLDLWAVGAFTTGGEGGFPLMEHSNGCG